MRYYSTNKQSAPVDFKQATIQGQAPDKGLYFPQTIPSLPKGMLEHIGEYSRADLAFEIIRPYVGSCIPENVLRQIVAQAIDFEFPLVELSQDIYALELFHGPTLAFKDVGARFMSRCLGYFVNNSDKKVTVLVATSGDTGGAVANGFYDVPGVEVVILYPSGKVSSVQELQLTTLGKNITALEVDGTFDDCQLLVKQAFADRQLNEEIFLTSANSINVSRWLPQQFYYFFAFAQWPDKSNPPVFSVPSGNFGNLCAGLLANRSGLRVSHFIAACNANDIVTQYLQTGSYQPMAAVATISNAMDVGDPSNFVRILELFDHEFGALKNIISSYSFDDTQTRAGILEAFSRFGYLTDPHGAVGYLALQEYLKQHPGRRGIFLETAHPVKFYDVVEPVIGQKIPLPAPVKAILGQKKQSIKIGTAYRQFRDLLGQSR